MARSHSAVRTIPRWFAGRLLMWSVLAYGLSQAASAQQGGLQLRPTSDEEPQLMARHSSRVTQLHIDSETAAPQFNGVRVPSNVLVSAALRPTLESMVRDSPTFRRQCARLASSPSITVSVEPVILAASAGFHAATGFSSDRSGHTLARVQLGRTMDREELIAHEFEHIIEQLDGVDLPSLARRATVGVRLTQDVDRFETERAIAVGRQVAQEIRTARRTRR